MSGGAPVTEAMPAGSLPPGLRVYAVGDIHGRFDLLERLTAKIGADLASAPAARAVEVYLGDYVDRGPDSRRIVEWLLAAPPLGSERICLLGNHEDLLLRSLDDPNAMSNWLTNGGNATIASYLAGLNPRPEFSSNEAVRAAFAAALPERHRAFLSSLPRTAILGGYFFVHAGIRPGVPLEAQDPEDLIWIRRDFLDSDADFGRMVVHGHTPVTVPDIRANRINIDTGAVFSGRLTCAVLEGTSRRFITVTHDET